MRNLFFAAVAFVTLSAFTIAAGTWTNDDPHTQLGFTVTHLGINDVSGAFTDVDITMKASKKDFSDATFDLTAKTASIDTRVEARNGHLKSADFFDVEKYPTLTFKSTSIKKAGNNQYQLKGDLTLHGVTKAVTLNAFYRGSVINPMSNKVTQSFQVTGTINRLDYGIGEKFPEGMVSNEVRIKADAEFVQE